MGIGGNMQFKAEIIRTTQRKLVSNDNQYEVVLRTENPLVLDLGKLPSDTMFDIEVKIVDNDDTWGNISSELSEH